MIASNYLYSKLRAGQVANLVFLSCEPESCRSSDALSTIRSYCVSMGFVSFSVGDHVDFSMDGTYHNVAGPYGLEEAGAPRIFAPKYLQGNAWDSSFNAPWMIAQLALSDNLDYKHMMANEQQYIELFKNSRQTIRHTQSNSIQSGSFRILGGVSLYRGYSHLTNTSASYIQVEIQKDDKTLMSGTDYGASVRAYYSYGSGIFCASEIVTEVVPDEFRTIKSAILLVESEEVNSYRGRTTGVVLSVGEVGSGADIELTNTTPTNGREIVIDHFTMKFDPVQQEVRHYA